MDTDPTQIQRLETALRCSSQVFFLSTHVNNGMSEECLAGSLTQWNCGQRETVVRKGAGETKTDNVEMIGFASYLAGMALEGGEMAE